MSRRVVVIGAGIAGLSAAYAAGRRGSHVTLVSAGAGATALGGGAVDDLSWEAWFSAVNTTGTSFQTRGLAKDVIEFSDALGLWDLPPDNAPAPILATVAGRLRPARGRDKALLDLGSFRQTTILVPRAPRAGWDADALAATLGDELLARRAGLRFDPVDATVLRFADEARIADADLAMRHDEPVRLAWLAERLREMFEQARRDKPADAYAVLLGSWLGASMEHATELSARVGVSVGEVLVGVGSTAGFRFEAARQTLLERLSLQTVTGRVSSLRRDGDRFVVTLADGSSSISADAIVLAMGGVAAGGVVYSPPDHEADEDAPPRVEPSFALAIDMTNLSVPLAVGTERVDVGGSMSGAVLDTTAWPTNARPSALEAVGVVAHAGQVCPGVMAAGDVVAGRRRTLLDAVASGLRAGQTV